MSRLKIVLLSLIVVASNWAVSVPDAEAGLLRDWLNRIRCRRALRAQVPVDNCATCGYTGLLPGQCQTTCEQTCSRVVVNYVPCTSYRTSYDRVPVTTYRPQTTSDPCTGCTVTCMRPCTTYTYQARRIPYTTYRPVYRTETYRVPVTTITNDCTTCGFPQAECATCSTGVAETGLDVPNGTIMTHGNFGVQPSTLPGTTITPLPTPADSIPLINPQDSNRSVIDSLNSGSATRIPLPAQKPKNWELTASQKSNVNNGWADMPARSLADASPVTRKWNYTPVKQSRYVSLSSESAEQAADEVVTVHGQFKTVETKSNTTTARQVNEGWETVDW